MDRKRTPEDWECLRCAHTCSRVGNDECPTCGYPIPPVPIGDPWWFDIPELAEGLRSLLMLDPADFAQWQSGDHAAHMVDRIGRILEWVEARQQSRTIQAESD